MLLNPDDPLSKVLTIAEAAQEIDRPTATLRDWIRKEWLVPLRIPGSRRTWTTARMVREAESAVWLRLTSGEG